MRKKSHISLAWYLMNSEGMESIQRHRGLFYIGSVLPDCLPSFIVRKHTMEDSFGVVEKELRKMVSHYNPREGLNRRFFIHLGVITHYISDYFTFPHNVNYNGKLKDHCIYEEELKHAIRSYVKSPEAVRKRLGERVNSPEMILAFIKRMYQLYSQTDSGVTRDCEYIVCLNHTIVDAILLFFEKGYNLSAYASVSC